VDEAEVNDTVAKAKTRTDRVMSLRVSRFSILFSLVVSNHERLRLTSMGEHANDTPCTGAASTVPAAMPHSFFMQGYFILVPLRPFRLLRPTSPSSCEG